MASRVSKCGTEAPKNLGSLVCGGGRERQGLEWKMEREREWKSLSGPEQVEWRQLEKVAALILINSIYTPMFFSIHPIKNNYR